MFGGDAGYYAAIVWNGFPGKKIYGRNDFKHGRIRNGDGGMVGLVAGKLLVKIIIRCCTIITAIMHGNKFKKIKVRIYTAMFKIMRYKVGQFENLSQLSIPKHMDANQRYDQNFTH
jgi:hypothetical protein